MLEIKGMEKRIPVPNKNQSKAEDALRWITQLK